MGQVDDNLVAWATEPDPLFERLQERVVVLLQAEQLGLSALAYRSEAELAGVLLENRAKEFAGLQQACVASQERLETGRREIEQAKDALAHTQAELSRALERVRDGDTALATSQAATSELRKVLAQLRVQVELETKAKNAAQRAMADTVHSAVAADSRARDAETARIAAEQGRRQAELENDLLKASTSWRITAPMRGFRRILPR